jgi:hypothetical protein
MPARAVYGTHFFKDEPPINNEAIHRQSDIVLSLLSEQLGQKRVKMAKYRKIKLVFMSQFWQAWTHQPFFL